MITLKYNRKSEEETKQCFETLSVRMGMNKQAILDLMNNPIADTNADAWFLEYKKEVEVTLDWIVGEALIIGNIRRYNGSRYTCIQAHTTQADWTPDVVPAIFIKIIEIGEGQLYPNWVQPTGAQDDYDLGQRVTHNALNWESTVDSNVWEPGVFGWTQI